MEREEGDLIYVRLCECMPVSLCVYVCVSVSVCECVLV